MSPLLDHSRKFGYALGLDLEKRLPKTALKWVLLFLVNMNKFRVFENTVNISILGSIGYQIVTYRDLKIALQTPRKCVTPMSKHKKFVI